MDWLTTFAVLALAVGSGLWLFDLLKQRRAWEAQVHANKVVRSKEHEWHAKKQAMSQQAHESEDRAEAMCGRRTNDDRGLQSPRRAVDTGADLALAQSSLDSAASILDGPALA